MASRKNNVIVIGAGMAGLAAARMLAEAGKCVTVIEARNRIGGRIETDREGGEALELGAEFVHGKPPELWRLIEEAKLETSELSGTRMCYDLEGLRECDGLWDDFQWLEKLRGWQGADCSFAEYLDHAKIESGVRARLLGYVEGFNAADGRRIGVAALGKQQAAEDAIEGDRLFRLHDGYARIPEFVARKVVSAHGSILLNARVGLVAWRRGYVKAVCHADGGRFEADCALITLPLGVLQGRSVEFSPQPATILEAAAEARMGQVSRIDLLFRERFWAKLGSGPLNAVLKDLSFLHASDEIPPVWWTPAPAKSNRLTGWVGGPRANLLAGLDENELADRACRALARVFHLKGEGPKAAEIHGLLLRCKSHDWQADPLSQGAYSYLPAGAMDAPRRMSEPVEETLYFAGEHTDTTGHWGTVHAALRSGIRAAQQILGIEAHE